MVGSMLKLAMNTVAIVTWSADRGRTFDREEMEHVCLTCKPDKSPYTAACAGQGHARRRVVQATMHEHAPSESHRVTQLYGKLHGAFRRVGYSCGGGVYLIPGGARSGLDEALAAYRAELDQANGEMQHCRAGYYVKLMEIDPGTAHEETLRSIRKDVFDALDKIMDAVRSGDAGAIRKVLREVRQVAQLADGSTRQDIEDLTQFAAQVAKRLREAAVAGEEQVEKVVEYGKTGVTRFAGLFAEQGDVAEEVA